MFDDLIRELRRLERTQQVSVSIPADEEGYLDRECPSPECLSQFKVYEEDWSDKVRDEEVFCPFCRYTSDSGKWWTQEQINHAEKAAFAQVQQRLNGAMRRDARRWNQRQPRSSFIRITMNVENKPTRVSLPPAAAEPMRLKITCPECSCRYAVIGAAFFCPACGHNAADMMFDQSIYAIRHTLEAQDAVRSAIPDRDVAETTVRLIIENGLQNAITTFQRYAEILYSRMESQRPRRNAFQNLGEGSDLWYSVTGKRYSDYLEDEEMAALRRLFQQRHLLAHTQGLVDADYIALSGDNTYETGQRIVVSISAVGRCLDLIEKLIRSMSDEK